MLILNNNKYKIFQLFQENYLDNDENQKIKKGKTNLIINYLKFNFNTWIKMLIN